MDPTSLCSIAMASQAQILLSQEPVEYVHGRQTIVLVIVQYLLSSVLISTIGIKGLEI